MASRPGTLPGSSNRPSLGNVASDVGRPSLGDISSGLTRPGPGSTRPSIGRPDLGRPDLGRPDIGKPGIGRPDIGRPDIGRPGVGGVDRPGLGKPDRPVVLPGDRPVIGGGRPGGGDRPIIGGGRPGFGNDRPVIGGGNNIGSGNVGNWIGNDFNFNFNVNNFNRPGWGVGGGGWQQHWGNHWYNRHVHHRHHGWYHGCWSGHWGNRWYVPVAVGATYWGFSALTSSWGYGYYDSYVNPYYTTTVVATVPVYDYSRPIVINNYISASDQDDAGDAATPPEAAESENEQAGYRLLDQGRDAFQRGNYKTALNLTEQAVRKVSDDPVIHEFGALCLFALGEYQQSAVVLNALLAVAPGMDWTTMISLYSNSDAYTEQLRALEAHIKKNPQDVAANFVLAYHYLVCGHADSAKNALQRVVEAQPNDQVARAMYDALTGDEEASAAEAEPPAATVVAKPAVEPEPAVEADAAEPTTDLVGQWRAERDGNTFEFTIDEAGEFTWKSIPKGQEPTAISGQYVVTGNALVMDGGDQGTLAGRVTSGGPDRFQFVLIGSPPSDSGLTFQRVIQAAAPQ